MSAMEMEITPQKNTKKNDSLVQQDENDQDNTPMVDGKRKRRKNDEEAELARRRRRRQSLAFQQRRKSLTPSKNKSGDTPTKQKRQYISDMYATVIKMSSENKINVKNSWSLHLIDHIDDILEPQEKNTVEDLTTDEGLCLPLPSSSGVNTVNTFNFQKASCTLDASVKIYSYRVDDTWNSSFKILENLSRTEEKDPTEDDDQSSPGKAASRKKNTSKKVSAGRTLEKNLNNINLKSYEMEYEVDPLFHKMSQTFDEGGAKGMLMANLGVYEGCKILLNSCDVQYSTRKRLDPAKEEQVDDACSASSKISILPFQTKLNTTFPDGVQDLDICPPIQRLYTQIEDLQDQDVVKNKISFRSSLSLNSFAFNNIDEDEDDDDDDDVGEDTDQNDTSMADISTPQKIQTIPEVDEGMVMDVDDDNSPPEVNEEQQEQEDYEFGMDIQEVVDMEHEADTEETGYDATQDDVPSSNDTSEYFSANKEKQEQEQAYSMIIENVLLHSFSEGLQNDYSYFDMKALKNWAGPAHWKFPTSNSNRLLNTKKSILDEVVEKQAEQEELQVAKATASIKDPKKSKKSTTTRTEHTSTGTSNGMLDFVSGTLPDLSILTKKPRASVISSTLLSKLSLKRAIEKSGDLVLPVDCHIKGSSLFHLFMKPSLRFFHPMKGGRAIANGSSLHGQGTNVDGSDDDDGEDGFEMEFGLGGAGEDVYEEQSQPMFDRLQDEYFGRQLLKADRVVEKIDVHYEKVAKRVDVKKLKKSIWDHLEKEEKILSPKQEEEQGPEDMIMDKENETQMQKLSNQMEKAQISTLSKPNATSFANVVENVSDKVPSNVTVSFYFICMLHLANEKGLELKGQEDLSNFQIRAGNNMIKH